MKSKLALIGFDLPYNVIFNCKIKLSNEDHSIRGLGSLWIMIVVCNETLNDRVMHLSINGETLCGGSYLFSKQL